MAYEELKRLAEEATPGPWQNGIDDLEGVVAPHNPGLGNVICIPPKRNMYSSLERWPDNAAFIAAANPSAILALIAQNETLERERDTLAEALRPFADMRVLEPNGVIIGLERWHFERVRRRRHADHDRARRADEVRSHFRRVRGQRFEAPRATHTGRILFSARVL